MYVLNTYVYVELNPKNVISHVHQTLKHFNYIFLQKKKIKYSLRFKTIENYLFGFLL